MLRRMVTIGAALLAALVLAALNLSPAQAEGADNSPTTAHRLQK
jgi:hypothetical protein